MEKVIEIGLLLDFYGQLLTERQFEIFDLHYNNDYSLGEIAEHLNISRQGVFDNIRRGKLMLGQMEDKLGLVRKFTQQKQKAEEVLSLVRSIDQKRLGETDKEHLRKVENGILDILNQF